MPKFDPAAEQAQFQLLDGDFVFEIVAVDSSISQGAKTRGSYVKSVKLKFFTDASFTKPAAQWTEDFIDAENCTWKWSVFAKCVGLVFDKGADFNIDETWIGYRGWATCSPKQGQQDPSKKFNHVVRFITDKPKLERAVAAAAPGENDDIPF